ncbi:MAG: transglycosylase domain-containing protein [Bacteroidia bacterium]|nr:transglycosylase domain-containing protein [Bacteroidia bacterium]
MSIIRISAGYFVLGIVGLLIFLGEAYQRAPHPPPPSPQFLDQTGQLIHVSLSPDGKWRIPPTAAAIERIAPLLLHKEDKNFWWHPGVDVIALFRATWNTLFGYRQGASTLTMQLARLWRPGERTIFRKISEIFWAIGIELRYSKAQILEYYLTYAPFGGNIEGIETAARIYFGKPAAQLSPLEVAALLLISQRPRLIGAFLRREKEFRLAALSWVRRWYEAGLLPQSDYDQAILTLLVPQRGKLPRLEPHILPPWRGGADTLFLSLSLQRDVQQTLRTEIRAWRTCGISEGAILVVEAATGYIRAYVPSTSYQSCAIDLIQTRRSVGSTLKPFLWAEALYRGKIHSESPLLDAPRSYYGYVPINFEHGRYQGIVSASEALRSSLNAPAVALLHEVGLSAFGSTLRTLGIEGAEHAGYSGIVGTIEASLFQIVQAYVPLATFGIYKKVRRSTSDTSWQRPMWDSASAWIVRAILNQNGWSYKTGTSAYLRDAWCIAYNERYIVGVWLGNPDGTSSGCLKGRSAALPLAQKITALLDKSTVAPMPSSVKVIKVCKETGLLFGADCPTSVSAWRKSDLPTLPTCSHKRYLWIDERYSYCIYCLPAASSSVKPYEMSPAPVALLREKTQIPPHYPKCVATEVEIISPLEGSQLWLRRAKVPLEAVSAPTSPILWGRGRDTLGWQMPGEPLWYLVKSSDTLLRLWAQVGGRRRETWCKIKFAAP